MKTHLNLGERIRQIMRFRPSKRTVVASAAIASVSICGIAGFDISTSRADVTLEVDGVSMPVTTWQATAGGVLDAAGIELGEYDLVQPAVTERVATGHTVVVRTAHPYEVQIDGRERTVWSTANSADEILSEASRFGSRVHLAADRSATRATAIPLVSAQRMVEISVDNTTQMINALPNMDARAVLAASGMTVSPLDRVTVTQQGASVRVDIKRVERGAITKTTELPFASTESESADLFEGESVVETVGVLGVKESQFWRESIDGKDVHSVLLSERTAAEPVAQHTIKGTKEATPEALIAANIDPKATLEEGVEADGKPSVRFRAKLGTISTEAEIRQYLGQSADPAAAAAAMAAGVPLVYSGEDPRTIAKAMVAARGWDDSQFQCLVTLWQRESSWNPYAENPSSGAYGIPQALPGSKMATAGDDWRTNPATQITWGLGYIAARYGTPCGALGHSNSVGWY